MEKESPIIGIDLGTSRSSVAVVQRNISVPIPDEQGRVDHPSVVYFPESGEPVVGHDAVPFLVSDPQDTVFAIKRLIGRGYNDAEVRKAVNHRPYQVVKSASTYPTIEVHGRRLTPSQISSYVIAHLKKIAEYRLESEIGDVVITVPANFNFAQREATRVAAIQAGLRVLRIVNEPTAAALSISPLVPDGKILIYDFGGGTFDVSVLEKSGSIFQVLATHGDMALGGEDVDRALADYIESDFRRNTGVDLKQLPRKWALLEQSCETIKIALSKHTTMPLRLNAIANSTRGPVTLSTEIDRKILFQCAAPLIERSLKVMHELLDRADVKKSELDSVILIGGTSQIPSLRLAVESSLGQSAIPGVHPTAAVALGAAELGAALKNGHIAMQSSLLLDVVPITLGVAGPYGEFIPLIQRNTQLPAAASCKLATQRDGQTDMTIEVLQGENEKSVENVQLGLLRIEELALAAAGEVLVEVHLQVDESGNLRVVALDKQSGRVNSNFVCTLSGMQEEDIEVLRLEMNTV